MSTPGSVINVHSREHSVLTSIEKCLCQ